MRIAAIAVAVLLLAAAPARADNNVYYVSGPGPDGTGPCGPFGGQTVCPTLRAAVNAANADTGTNTVIIPAGEYPISGSALNLQKNVNIAGAGARNTLVEPSGVQGFTINSGVTAAITGLTVSGGTATSGAGGDIANNGKLTLTYVRLTGGTATLGGGLANQATGATATVQIALSLFDHNSASSGGGIANLGATFAASVSLYSSTVAFSSNGGGIYTSTNATTALTEVTVGRNSGTGLQNSGAQVAALGSIVAGNTTNCSGTITDSGANLSDTSACAFGTGAGTDPQLDTGLTNQGGQTDVLTIPAGSPAIDRVKPCVYPVDQRDGTRVSDGTQACDAGAYEQAPIVPVTPTPTPTPPPTPPPPVATPTPTPTPVIGRTVVIAPVRGTTTIQLPGSKRFVALDPSKPIPLGATVDTRNSEVRITSKSGSVADFYDGLFKLTQSKGVTILTLTEPLAPCKSGARIAKKKPRTRKLWGNGSGAFSTRGQYSAATVRGTKWLVQDSCSGTLTRVAKGVVSVRDDVKRKTILLRAPHSYTARPKR